MSSEEPVETAGRTSVASASGRPLSDNPDAVRKRNARAAAPSKSSTTSSGRGGEGAPATKGNPLRPSDWSTMGEPLSPHEAERQLYWAHVGLAKAIQSDIDLSELKEEFEVAGENYAFVANKMWPPLRVMIRFVAPVVLIAVLVVIWGHMLAHTPWIRRVHEWWRNRAAEEQPSTPQVVVDAPPRPHVVSNGAVEEERQAPPPLPRRPVTVRRLHR